MVRRLLFSFGRRPGVACARTRGERAALAERDLGPDLRSARVHPRPDPGAEHPGLRVLGRFRLGPHHHARSRGGLAPDRCDHLGVRAAPRRPLSRRYAVHRRGRGLQPAPGAVTEIRIRSRTTVDRGCRGRWRLRRAGPHDRAESSPAGPAVHDRDHVQGLDGAAWRGRGGALRRCRDRLCRGPREWHGPVRAAGLRAGRAHGAREERGLVGLGQGRA